MNKRNKIHCRIKGSKLNVLDYINELLFKIKINYQWNKKKGNDEEVTIKITNKNKKY